MPARRQRLIRKDAVMSSTAQNYPSTQYRERDDLRVAPTAQLFWSECNKLTDLIAEHDDLDQAVASMLSALGCDDLAISRLKKRKLRVRDEISQARAYLRRLTESLAQSGATISRTAISL